MKQASILHLVWQMKRKMIVCLTVPSFASELYNVKNTLL